MPRRTFEPDSTADSEIERLPFMQRGVSQLLFNYLPSRTVDWEDGLAIVQLGAIRFSSIWDEDKKSTLLNEMEESFARWSRRGGRIDPTFPNRKHESTRYTVGMPESVEATVLDAALICQRCGQLIFEKRVDYSSKLTCPNCGGLRVHQIPFVFVHGCGELVPITEWLPATKRNTESGRIEPTKHPIRCPECNTSANLYIPGKSDRVKDMKVLCRKCNAEARDRLTARCHRCLRRLMRGPQFEEAKDGGKTIVQEIAMRLARYSASDAYYPFSMSVLRLDKPKLNSGEDEMSTVLYKMLPQNLRPDADFSVSDTIMALSEKLKLAKSIGDHSEEVRIMSRIAEIVTGKAQAAPPKVAGFFPSVPPELEKGIRESLAFRTTVTSLPAEDRAERDGGLSDLLRLEIARLKNSLGIAELQYVEDLPIISATVGYTRRDFNPTYEELGAQDLPVEVRAFPSLQKDAAQRLARPELVGTIPIPAREAEHEGIFISLDACRVLAWLEVNGIRLPSSDIPTIARIMQALEPIDHDRYYDSIWQWEVRRLVFGLIHSFSHAAMRAITRYAGIDRTSVAEYVFLPMLGFVVYDNSNTFKLGGVATLVRDHLAAFLETMANESVECLYDPDCADHTGACHGCLHSPEIACRVFNHGLSRSFLMGGHSPWVDVASDYRVTGYWETMSRP
ncbi:DUF1998 domain-containing protein [Edaphobacter bradus]|uniref:DUF1998 domain-containing protein n=1 Tax=Edaphobacter bradus TaxID=2259016 RepID=UPI0021DF4E08|nr:hypothetical protein [Edaphobacter bradus]